MPISIPPSGTEDEACVGKGGPGNTPETWLIAGWKEECADRQEAAHVATAQPKH